VFGADFDMLKHCAARSVDSVGIESSVGPATES
jgi:hypothetical protein